MAGGGTNGIFVMIELAGALRAEVHAIQQKYDPRLAREAAPHVTLIGSSGAGPIDPATPVEKVKEALWALAERHQPFAVPFGPPMRLGERTVIALPLDPHGPIRALHEDLRASGLSMAASRWPFTPHCTLSFYPELERDRMREIAQLRVSHPLSVTTLRVYHTRDPLPPRVLVDVLLGPLPFD